MKVLNAAKFVWKSYHFVLFGFKNKCLNCTLRYEGILLITAHYSKQFFLKNGLGTKETTSLRTHERAEKTKTEQNQ